MAGRAYRASATAVGWPAGRQGHRRSSRCRIPVQVSGGVTFEGLVESIADGRAKSRRDQMENAANEEHRADENGTGKRDRHPRPEQKDARSPEP